MSLTRSLPAVTLVAAALLVTGCGGGSKSPKGSVAPSPTSAASTSAASTSPAATSSSAVAPATPAPSSSTAATSTGQTSSSSPTGSVSSVGGDCGNATVAVNKATNASPESDQVLDIELKGGCAAVTLGTVLAPGNSSAGATALKICQTAATPAYANGAGAVIVLGVGGTELAGGTKGSSCVKKG
jgi:hypothetical protein